MAKHRRRRRRLRIGRLLILLGILIGIVFLFFTAIRMVSSLFDRPQEETVETEPTPTPDPVYKNDYDWQYLIDNEGVLSYEDGTYTSSFGIDVSHYQDFIDWQAVKNAGVEFAFIRAGYRGYTEGVLYEDTMYRDNIEGATEAGIEVGVYFFSQAVNAEEAEEEAGFTLNLIKDYPVNVVVYDLEISSEEERAYDNDQDVNTAAAYAFAKKIKDSGYTPLIYGSKNFFYHEVRMEDLQDLSGFWLASYGKDTPEFPYVFEMWQYSCTGEIDGISTNVDLNIRFEKK